MEIEQTEKQLSESDLKIFEEKFQINLPDAFKEQVIYRFYHVFFNE